LALGLSVQTTQAEPTSNQLNRVSFLDGDRLRIDWTHKLRPTQDRFYHSPATRKIYIGPVGSGKTEILCRTFLSLLFRRPGNVGMIGRLTYKDFENSTLMTLEELIPASILHPGSRPSKGMLKIRTVDPRYTSTILFAHFDSFEQFGSFNGGVVAVDEITEVPGAVFKFLETRLRMKGPKVHYLLGSGNPAGHDFYWKEFHPESPNHKEGYQIFTPLPFENSENLPPSYYENLIARNERDWVERFVYGSFDTFEGQVYVGLNEKIHRKPNDSIPMPPPPEWPRVISLDHGLRNPTAVGFWCIDYDGNWWCYDEHYEFGKPIAYHAEKIKEKVKAHVDECDDVTWVIDPSCFSKIMSRGGRLYSVYDEYEEHGLGDWTPGENDKVAGRNRVTELIRAHRMFFLRRCEHHWDEMTRLHWRKPVGVVDQRHPEQEAAVDDHCPDETRYAVMSRPDVPIRRVPKVEPTHSEVRRSKTKRLFREAREQAVRDAQETIRPKRQGDYV